MKTFSQLDAGLAILRVASQFIDMHEISSNAQWSRPVDSKLLLELMQKTGWQKGWPYCAAFVEACYGTACQQFDVPEIEKIVRAKFTPSVMQTYNNVKQFVHTNTPKPGSVFFMQKGASALGHAGLVILAGEKTMCTVEGNTSPGVVDANADREGDGVYMKIRRITFVKSSGLHLLGFLDPMDTPTIQQLLTQQGAA